VAEQLKGVDHEKRDARSERAGEQVLYFTQSVVIHA
jgi:hypothetical protein